MSESRIDKEAAYRFMSSLSKSLQALCHGCMEFESGIKIMGYINIDIDSNDKVDYVLNEKVMKSETNAMTFVSNSFLAEKTEAKRTKDGSCSPNLEFEPQPLYNSQEYPHFRSDLLPSLQSQVFPSARKRSWKGTQRDWRPSPKKQSRGREVALSQIQKPEQVVRKVAYQSPSASEDSNAIAFEALIPKSNFPNGNTESINIKKEVMEHEDDNSCAGIDYNSELSASVSADINVKLEPDVPCEESCVPTPVNGSLVETQGLENIEALEHFQGNNELSSFEVNDGNTDHRSHTSVSQSISYEYGVGQGTSYEEQDNDLIQMAEMEDEAQIGVRDEINYMKTLLDNQLEILRLQKELGPMSGHNLVDIRDLIPRPHETVEELEDMCQQLDNDEQFKLQLIQALKTVGGARLTEGLRAMMRLIAKNVVWEKYSLKGRLSGKAALQDMSVCSVIVQACKASFKNIKTHDVHGEIGMFLRYAPHRPGGSKYEEKKKRTERTEPAQEEMHVNYYY